ncbi:MAG: hypothetical protein ACI9F9_003184 [Candidatus Paceibacteria bacterium]|jgi:hypothetical protein
MRSSQLQERLLSLLEHLVVIVLGGQLRQLAGDSDHLGLEFYLVHQSSLAVSTKGPLTARMTLSVTRPSNIL